MVYEIARFEIIPGKEVNFEAGVVSALPLFHRAHGCESVELQRVVEHPNHYVLVVRWVTLEDHTVRFRQSDDFQEWRRLVGPYFQNAPEVVHTERAVK